MADIFREVDEEVRHDRIQRVLSRNWGWLLLAVLVVMAGVGAWRAWDYLRVQREEAAGDRYLAALDLTREGKGPAAIAAFDDIAKTGTPGYAVLARLRAAAQQGLTDPAAGAKAFDAVAADPAVDPILQNVARLRAAILLVDTQDLKDMRARLQPLADANSPMRNPAREILALSALKANDYAAAGPWLDAIVADSYASGPARQRARDLLGVVRSNTAAKS